MSPARTLPRKLIRVPVYSIPLFAGGPVPFTTETSTMAGVRTVPQPIGTLPTDKLIIRRVCGDSLIDVRIADGDWVMYKQADSAKPGQLVVISTPHGDTVKFYWPKEDGWVELKAANPEYPNQIWSEEEIVVRGVVVMSGQDWQIS